MSPFEMDLGWCPKSPLDSLASSVDNNESVEEFKTRLKESLMMQYLRTEYLSLRKVQDQA